jgi:hypothetical protein
MIGSPERFRPDTVAGQIVAARGHAWAARALESFKNHWRSANGPNARKRDWQAAWANWIIEQDNRDGRRTNTWEDINPELARDIGSFAYDPLKHALYAFPWGEAGPPLEEREGSAPVAGRCHGDDPRPSRQSRHPLSAAAHRGRVGPRHRQVGRDRDAQQMGARLLGRCRVVITANTEQQLITKTSPEVAKWHRMAITRDWFKPRR